jgi:cytochrome c
MLRALVLLLFLMKGAPLAAGAFFTLSGHGGPVKGIAVGPEGEVATASFDNAVGFWAQPDQAPGNPVWLDAHEAAVNAVAFIDSGRLVSAGDDFAVYLWDLTTGTSRKLGQHQGKVMALRVAPDGHSIASASWDGSIGIWPLEETGVSFMTGHSGAVNDVVYSADGQQLYSASADGSIRLWDLKTGEQVAQILSGGFGINRLILNEAAGWLAYGAVDGVTRVIDPVSRLTVMDFTLERRPVLAMALDGSGRFLAVGDGHGYISVLDSLDWSLRVDFRATQRGPVWALAFDPSGQTLYAAGLDNQVFAWPVMQVGQLPATTELMAAGQAPFLKGGSRAMSAGERQFNRKCSICHSLSAESERRAGPTLKNLFGRPAGVVPDYSYSERLRRGDIIWDETSIDALFDQGPEVYIEGSKMPMQRITNPEDRAALIAFLRSHSDLKE